MGYNKFQEMQALLEMIAPTDEELAKDPNASHGSPSYRSAKEFFDFTIEYIEKLEDALHSAESYQDSTCLNGKSKYKADKDYLDLMKFKEKNKL